jgi:FkbM family methyltransferase
MSMLSFAQNWEDVWLRRAFPGQHTGFFVDVGANDPVIDSVTKHFYDSGWHGINVEPLQGCYKRLAAARTRDLNLHMGLSNREGSLTFHEVPLGDGWSTFSAALADSFRQQNIAVIEHSVPVSTLANILEKHAKGTIDFLKIDVEGHEREVIEGGDWQRWRPRVVLVEAGDPSSWEPTLLAASYLFAAFDGINRYYVRGEEPQLLGAFQRPVCSLDDFISYRHQFIIDDLQRQVTRLESKLGPVGKLRNQGRSILRRLLKAG